MMANMKAPMQMIEEQVKRNTEMCQQAMSMFSPFGLPTGAQEEQEAEKPEANDIDELKAQLKDLQGKLDKFS